MTDALAQERPMNAKGQCAQCGAPLPADISVAICPQCELRGALNLFEAPTQASSDPGAAPAAPSALVTAPDGARDEGQGEFCTRRFGDYELLEEIARGGMGIVYRARQVSLDRIVAVKMLLAGPLAGKDFIQRFRTEAAAAASLQHPNIVAIHEVGFADGQHFFAMDFVEGLTLGQLVAKGPLPARQAARYLKTISEAIHFAHERNVLHRDLKPSNVLIDSATDQPRVTDFGLAKRLEAETDLTLSGQVLGSPNYMSPEQAAARRGAVGKRSDVYSLGAILYHLLTGRPPFQGQTLTEVLHQVMNDEPLAPRLLTPQVPRDLETICLKCLEKEASRRYQTAQELVDELSRFLEDEPILARPVSPTEYAWRWCRRKPALATLSAAVGLLLLTLGLGAPIAAWRIDRERQLAEAAAQRETLLRLQADAQAYSADMSLVQQVWNEGNLRRAQALLRSHVPEAGPDLRGFEWHYLSSLCKDESWLTVSNFPKTVRAAPSPDGAYVAAISGPVLKLLDYRSGREIKTLRSPLPGSEFLSVAFSPVDGNVLATSTSNSVLLWDLANSAIATAINFSSNVTALAFSPTGDLLAAGSDAGIELWNLTTRSRISFPGAAEPLSGYISQVAFYPNGEDLLCCRQNRDAILSVNLLSGRHSLFPAKHTGTIFDCLVSPDGAIAVTGAGDSRIIIWDAASGTEQKRIIHPGSAVSALGLSADRQLLLSGSSDSTVRLWDLGTGQQKHVFRGHRGEITAAFFSPDQRQIISSSADGTIKVWDVTPVPNDHVLHTNLSWTGSISFSPDGKKLATVDVDHGVFSLWDIATRSHITNLTEARLDSAGASARFSPDGRWLALHTHDRKIQFWDATTFARLHTLTNPFAPHSFSVSPDSRLLAAAGVDAYGPDTFRDRLAFWDVNARKKLDLIPKAAQDASCVTFAQHDSLVVIGYMGGEVRIWNYKTEELVAEFRDQHQRIWSAIFSPDDRWVVAGGNDGAVVFYDWKRRRPYRPSADTSWWVLGLAFSADGRTLASAEGDGTVRLWNVFSRHLALELRGHAGPVSKVAFSPDGSLLASCGGDGTVRLWSAPLTADNSQNALRR